MKGYIDLLPILNMVLVYADGSSFHSYSDDGTPIYKLGKSYKFKNKVYNSKKELSQHLKQKEGV